MNPKRRRFGVWKIIGLVFVGILLVVLGFRACQYFRARQFLEEADGRVDILIAEVRARPDERQVLRGKPEPGNAWDDYEAAFAAMDVSSDEWDVLSKGEDLPQVRSIVARNEEALAALARGAGRARARYDYDWQAGAFRNPSELMKAFRIVELALARARLLRKSLRTGEATGWVLDAAQFLRDFAATGTMTEELLAHTQLFDCFDALRELLMSRGLSAGELVILGRSLAILDSSFPRHDEVILNDTLVFMSMLMIGRESEDNLLYGILGTTWTADTLAAYEDSQRRRAEAERVSWDEVMRVSRELKLEAKKDGNPILLIMAPTYVSLSAPSRTRRAQLRLLRVAAHYAATGEILELDDPFDGPLKAEIRGTTLKVWSVGKDGVDYGGKGDWRGSGPDVVLEGIRKP